MNGEKYAKRQRIARASNVKNHFAHLYSSWKRGANENIGTVSAFLVLLAIIGSIYAQRNLYMRAGIIVSMLEDMNTSKESMVFDEGLLL